MSHGLMILGTRFQIMLTSDSWDCDAMPGGDAMRYAIIVLAFLDVRRRHGLLLPPLAILSSLVG